MSNIKVFTKQGCPYCAALKDALRKEGTEFAEVDVHSSPRAMQEALSYSGGRRLVPILVRDGAVTVGFNGG